MVEQSIWQKYFDLKPLGKVKSMVIMALMVALSVILERLLGYNDKLISVSFSYLPIALTGMLYGFLPAAIVAGLADMVGAVMFPVGEFNILFTLIALFKGGVYGLFLYKAEGNRVKIVCAQLIITFVAHLALNTLVISAVISRGFFALLPIRIFKNLLFLPIEIITLFKMSEYRKTFERLAK